jgi:diguanylate cyclase (GGDEF)-like protein/PAS domain S-box-containing protein
LAVTEEQIAMLVGQLIDHVPELVVIVDQVGQIRYANLRAQEMLRMPADEWIGRPVFDVIHPDDVALALELMVSANATGAGIKEPVTYRLRTGDGSWAIVEVIACNVALPGGELAMVLSGRQSKERRPGWEVVSEASARLSRMFDDALIGMAQTSLDGRFLRLNRSFARMLGYRPEQLVGTFFAGMLHPDDAAEGRAAFARLISGEMPTYRRSARYVTADGRIVHAEVTATLIRDRHGVALYCAAQAIDITELREAQAEVLHNSTHDQLTGLANRALLMSQLSLGLERASTRRASIAVMFLDLDGFKSVNDTYGHSAGDDLLIEVARRVGGIVRQGDIAARVGGDEFVVMCEAADPTAVRDIANRLSAALAMPFSIGSDSVQIGVSVGIAIEPAENVTADELIMHADTALYDAKRQGRGQISLYQTTPR